MRMRNLFIFILLLSVAPQDAFAGYLTIKGISEIRLVSKSDSEVSIEGTYSIENKGDEDAREVYPVFAIGQWKWAGNPVSLSPNGVHRWELSETFSAKEVTCPSGTNCFSVTRGIVPLKVRRMYKDMNGYQFSSVDVVSLPWGEMTESDNVRIRIPQLQSAIAIKGDGQHFEGKLKLASSASKEREVQIEVFASEELRTSLSRKVATIKEESETELELSVRNFKGLAGSRYVLVALIQWQDEGLLHYQNATQAVTIAVPSTMSFFIKIFIVSLFFVCLLLYWFVFRPVPKS